jgi:hypothetical protein
MAKSIGKVASYIYGAGILANIGIGIHQENMELERVKQKNTNVNIKLENYAMYSFGGACLGMISGIMWPIAMFGRLSVILTPK